MPPSSERASQEPLFNLDPDLQRGGRKRSPGRKKGKRKNETTEKGVERGGAFGGHQNEMTAPSSILAQIQKSTPAFTPQNDRAPATFDTWNQDPSQFTDTHAEEPLDWPSTIPYGQSPPDDRARDTPPPAASPPRYHTGPDMMREGFNPASPPASPQNAYRQLVHRSSDYQTVAGRRGFSPHSRRTSSTHSQPPPPHQPQAHFYGAPELDFGMPRSSSKHRERGESTFCAFDCLPSCGHDGREGSGDVLLVGFDHGLDIYQLDRKRFDHMGRLTGLRGSVVRATVLPASMGHQTLKDHQPLVAMVIHGPATPTDAPLPSRLDPLIPIAQETPSAEVPTFETTVEVYSLKSGSHIQTLFRCPKRDLENRLHGFPTLLPPPSGDLSLDAKGRFLVLSCGRSGEVYIFECPPAQEAEGKLPFRCLGKIWTRTTPRTHKTPAVSPSEPDLTGLQDELHLEGQQAQVALLSVSPRWLAFLPPVSSAQTSMHGSVTSDLPTNKVPGLSSHASPNEPAVTCHLDTPDAESFLNKVARDGAQTLMKGAQWVSSQGVQAWNSYWSKPPEPTPPRYSSSYPYSMGMGQFPGPHIFPPTHAQDTKSNSGRIQSTLVSIMDLEKLSGGQNLKPTVALEPVATFSLPSGCSLLSFTPEGLKLMTASAKGDVQQVWDLMRMIHGEAGRYSDPEAEAKGPAVREVARFTRMTEAKIVDVVWTEPRGARLALVTDRGTVHIHDMPASAFQWPPPLKPSRNLTPPPQSTDSPGQDGLNVTPQSTGSTLTSAFGMLSTTTQPILAAVRGRRTSAGSSFPTFGGFTTTAGIGAKGGKAVAAGVNRSVSAAAMGTYNTIRHLGENRIALPTSSSGAAPGCVRWMVGRDHGALAVTGGGVVRIYGIHQSDNPKAGRRRPSVLGNKPTEYSIPSGRTTDSNPTRSHPTGRHDPPGHQQPRLPGSFWRSHPPRPTSQSGRPNNLHPLSFAEIDTSAAYQPFHADRRVNLYVSDQDPRSTQPSRDRRQHSTMGGTSTARGSGSATWLFGQPIPATKISSGSSSSGRGELSDDRVTGRALDVDDLDHYADEDELQLRTMMENVVIGTPSEGVEDDVMGTPSAEQQQQQIVITTTKRKKKSRKTPGITTAFADVGDLDAPTYPGTSPSLAPTVATPTTTSTITPRKGARRGADGDDNEIFEDDCEVVDFTVPKSLT